MTHHRRRAAPIMVLSVILLSPSLIGQEHRTYTRFELGSPDTGPFPSDRFTLVDDTQNTGLRVSLPKRDCDVNVTDCEEIDVINTLDGFNLQPRLSIPFTGPIDPNTVTSETMFLVSLGSTLPNYDGTPWGTRVGIDQIVWDRLTDTLHVESDTLLDQHTRYVLVMTKDVRDEDGKGIKAAKEFLNFVDEEVTESTGDPSLDAYRAALHGALTELDTHGIVPRGQVVAASVFTTQSATAILEKIRDQIHAATPAPADFLLGPNDERTVFSLSAIAGITWNQQQSTSGPLVPTAINLGAIKAGSPYPGAVGTLAFGRFRAADYSVHPGEYIPPVGTRSGTPSVLGYNEIYFNLFLPSGLKPANGWPVVIFGHGVNQNKNAPPINVAASMANRGIATIAINVVGHGFGEDGTLRVSPTAGSPIEFPAGGRGFDRNGDGSIEDSEGATAASPRDIVFWSDGYRQTAADLMQLSRVIDVGVDVDGDGHVDLDPSRIYYLGASLGGGYGTVFVAVEPNVHAAVLMVPVDPPLLTWSLQFRSFVGFLLNASQPSLLNSPGVTAISGRTYRPYPPPPAPGGQLYPFDENMPLKDQTRLTVQLGTLSREIVSPVTSDVPGAMAIQRGFDRRQWASSPGSPVAYAPHLRKTPLPGVAAKPVVYQIGKGDESAPNPTTTALLRAGDLADRTLFYRHDLARAINSTLPQNPHGFLNLANFGAIALGAQTQSARFFQSDGAEAIQPAPAEFFEWPIVGPLPEALNYLP